MRRPALRCGISGRCFTSVCRAIPAAFAASFMVGYASVSVLTFGLLGVLITTSITHYGGDKTGVYFVSPMLWCDDPDLIAEIYLKIPKKIRHLFDFEWVKLQIPKFGWDDVEVRKDNIRDIVKEARAVAKYKGVKDAPLVRGREYESAGLGQSYATRSAMQKHVEKLRLKYWGEPGPPFEITDTGFQEATNWFYTHEKQDAADYPDEFPGTAEVRFKVSTQKALLVNAAILKVFKAYGDAEGHVPLSQELAFALAKQLVMLAETGDAAFIGFNHSGFRNETINLGLFAPSGGKREVRAIEGKTLHNLLEDVRTLADVSSWWTEEDALTVVLFDNFISAEVRVKNNAGIRKGIPFREITLTVTAPMTGEEVKEAYNAELKRLNIRPKTFTMVQSALFQLHLEYPYSSATHAERYAVWQGWRKITPKLTDYKSQDSLRRSLESALEAAKESWGRNMGFEDIFRPFVSHPEQ